MKSKALNILVLACLLASATADAGPRRLLSKRHLRGAPSRRAFAFWKEKFWKKQLEKAVNQVNRDKDFFKNQYKSYKTKRCQKFIQSRGKRLKTTKY